PGEIEDELKSCRGVADAQVVEVDLKGQARCVAFVIAEAVATPKEEQLTARLRERLAGYKVPARIFLVDAFPVTESANGIKVQRGKLREIAMEKIAKGGCSTAVLARQLMRLPYTLSRIVMLGGHSKPSCAVSPVFTKPMRANVA